MQHAIKTRSFGPGDQHHLQPSTITERWTDSRSK